MNLAQPQPQPLPLPGIHFTPSDKELVVGYLVPRVSHQIVRGPEFIYETDFHSSAPDTLAATFPGFDGVWYFWTTVQTKNNAPRQEVRRWRRTGTQANVMLLDHATSISSYCYIAQGRRRTSWRLKEYTLNAQRGNQNQNQNQNMICKLYISSAQSRARNVAAAPDIRDSAPVRIPVQGSFLVPTVRRHHPDAEGMVGELLNPLQLPPAPAALLPPHLPPRPPHMGPGPAALVPRYLPLGPPPGPVMGPGPIVPFLPQAMYPPRPPPPPGGGQ